MTKAKKRFSYCNEVNPFRKKKSSEGGFSISGEKKYSYELKLQLVHEYLDADSKGFYTIVAKYEASRSPLRRWVNLSKAGGENQLLRTRHTYVEATSCQQKYSN